jgi:RNA polymerase sigma-70 factor (ECF subfamily)
VPSASAALELSLGSVEVAATLASDAAAQPSDRELVMAVRAGQRSAEERLYRRHVRAVAAIAVRLLGPGADADDVVQDSFVTALERLRQLREPELFRPWLLRIAVSHVHRRFRRRRLLRWLGLDRSVEDTRLAQQAAPGLHAEARAELQRLDTALHRLPPDVRIAWILRHVEGYELTDVACACGVSLATIKRRLHTAEAFVRSHLQGGKP